MKIHSFVSLFLLVLAVGMWISWIDGLFPFLDSYAWYFVIIGVSLLGLLFAWFVKHRSLSVVSFMGHFLFLGYIIGFPALMSAIWERTP